MRPLSKFSKHVVAGLVGVLYAVLYGFWTLLATGGGHVNFIWAFLFLSADLIGLYFPLMAILAVNLRHLATKITFGGLIGFNVVVSIVNIIDWVRDDLGTELTDFARTLRSNGYETVVFCGALHFLPTIVFAILLVRSIIRGSDGHGKDFPEIVFP